MARGFEQLLAFDGDVMAVYDRTFTVEREVLGERLVVELKPSGADILLTAENRQGKGKKILWKTRGCLLRENCQSNKTNDGRENYRLFNARKLRR